MSEQGGGGPLGFGDEAPDEERAHDPGRYAHRQDPDLAAYGIGPDAAPVPPRQPPGTSRYTWFVGVLAVLIIAYVSVNTITSKGPGSRGVPVGDPAPPFAAPLALGNLTGDVNVARKPKQGSAGKVVACSIHRPDVLNLCDQYRSTPVVLAFFVTHGKQCTGELDELQRLSRLNPEVRMTAVAIRGQRGDVRKLIRSHGWTFPVGYDHDGVLANLYGVAVCPHVTYIRRGGRVAGTSLGTIPENELAARVAALAAGRVLPPRGAS